MRRLGTFALLALLHAPAGGQESAVFLTMGGGARAAAMGGAQAAVADDLDAAAGNPAGLALIDKTQAQLAHRESIARTRYNAAGFARPTSRGTLAATLTYLSHDDLAGRDAAGVETGGYGAADLSAGISGAAKLPALGLRLGAGAKYVHSRIAEASAQTVAFDFGAQSELPWADEPGSAVIGVAVRNLGPGLRFLDERSPLPLTLTGGLGYRLSTWLTVGLDFSRRPYAVLKDEVSAGAELAVVPGLPLRLGFASAASRTRGAGVSTVLGGFTAGLGVRVGEWRLDYSMAPMGELGSAQTFSLAAWFGAPREK